MDIQEISANIEADTADLGNETSPEPTNDSGGDNESVDDILDGAAAKKGGLLALQDEPTDEVDPEEQPADPDLIDLGDGEPVSKAELLSIHKLYKGSKDPASMRANYLRQMESFSGERKAFEAERTTLSQHRDTVQNLEQKFQRDPVEYAREALELAAQNGLIRPELYHDFVSLAQKGQQEGYYNPAQLQARAAQMQANQQSQQFQAQQHKAQLQSNFWSFQEQVGRILSPEEKQKIFHAIEYAHINEGGRVLTFAEAWQRVEASKPPPKPVIAPSPVKQVQALKNKKPTLERATGRATSAKGYSEDDVQRDLDRVMSGLGR